MTNILERTTTEEYDEDGRLTSRTTVEKYGDDLKPEETAAKVLGIIKTLTDEEYRLLAVSMMAEYKAKWPDSYEKALGCADNMAKDPEMKWIRG